MTIKLWSRIPEEHDGRSLYEKLDMNGYYFTLGIAGINISQSHIVTLRYRSAGCCAHVAIAINGDLPRHSLRRMRIERKEEQEDRVSTTRMKDERGNRGESSSSISGSTGVGKLKIDKTTESDLSNSA